MNRIIDLKGIPTININGLVFEGWYVNAENMHVSHLKTTTCRFNNDFTYDVKKLEGVIFWNVIESENFQELPLNTIITIDQITYNEIPPLDMLPHIFNGISFIRNEDGYFVEYDSMLFRNNANTNKKETWNKKWAVDFYSKELLKYSSPNEFEVFINEASEDDLELEMSIKISIKTPSSFKNAFSQSLNYLENILNKIELDLAGFDDLLELSDLWKRKDEITTEKSWQKILKANSWILSLAFSQPMLLFENEGFLGGKSIGNKHGKIVDFVYQNQFTKNILLIEIKTPSTKLIGAKYRDTFSFSKELTGGISQTLSYINTLNKDFYSISANSENNFDFLGAKALLVIGSISELNPEKRLAFELFRNSISSLEIITFDELFEKIFMILSIAKDSK
ncbi:MAG: DUF4263 domain-containing protein [Crocinitomix sp.]|nr:DUF4263 domain-containing protein [Crocinitomix sp.]